VMAIHWPGRSRSPAAFSDLSTRPERTPVRAARPRARSSLDWERTQRSAVVGFVDVIPQPPEILGVYKPRARVAIGKQSQARGDMTTSASPRLRRQQKPRAASLRPRHQAVSAPRRSLRPRRSLARSNRNGSRGFLLLCL
jgi:hypothetical protein